MLMTPLKLVVLRLYMITFGHFPLFSRLIRRVLVFILIKKQADKSPYIASSRFLDISELEV